MWKYFPRVLIILYLIFLLGLNKLNDDTVARGKFGTGFLGFIRGHDSLHAINNFSKPTPVVATLDHPELVAIRGKSGIVNLWIACRHGFQSFGRLLSQDHNEVTFGTSVYTYHLCLTLELLELELTDPRFTGTKVFHIHVVLSSLPIETAGSNLLSVILPVIFGQNSGHTFLDLAQLSQITTAVPDVLSIHWEWHLIYLCVTSSNGFTHFRRLEVSISTKGFHRKITYNLREALESFQHPLIDGSIWSSTEFLFHGKVFGTIPGMTTMIVGKRRCRLGRLDGHNDCQDEESTEDHLSEHVELWPD